MPDMMKDFLESFLGDNGDRDLDTADGAAGAGDGSSSYDNGDYDDNDDEDDDDEDDCLAQIGSQRHRPRRRRRRFRKNSSGRDSGRSSSSNGSSSGGNTIFESAFDLTDERLRIIFDMIDQDGNGRISYDELKKGLELHTHGSTTYLDDDAFQQLLRYLDSDHSGDVSFEEFSEGIRLLMLRGLLRTADLQKEDIRTVVFDYNANRLESHLIEGDGEERLGGIKDASRSQPLFSSMSIYDFYFTDRPDWVDVRWIDATGKDASRALRRLGVKYRLHPLEIEDALEGNHRPKAEAYSNREFYAYLLLVLTLQATAFVLFSP